MPWNVLDDLAAGQVVTESHMDDLRENIEHLGGLTIGGVALSAQPAAAEIGVPVGTGALWFTSTAPAGWLICDGSAVSRTTYAALFALWGTTFGVGDGSTTFNLPDGRGRFMLGADNLGGTSANRVTATQADTIGGTAGAETHTLTEGEMPNIDIGVYKLTSGSGGGWAVNASYNLGVALDKDLTPSFGGGGAHNNMPPYITVAWIVKY
ncbi:MAG: phage tail protein [Anaerolineales bacterium]